MAEQEKDQHLDEMLDSLLASYSTADPRPGMEMRIHATLERHARQRRRGWILALAGSAAAVLLVLAITNVRTAKQDVTARVGIQQLSPEVAPGNANKSVPAPQAANTRFVHQRRENPYKDETNRAILQMADLTHQYFAADELPSEPEKLHPGPTPRQEPEPAIAQLKPAPNISIRDLGVQSIEIKELTPARDKDEKGNL